MWLQERVAIVTGGASGMGECVVELFAQEGAAVVIGDIDGRRAGDVAARIKKTGGRCLAVELDVVDEQQVRALVGKQRASTNGSMPS